MADDPVYRVTKALLDHPDEVRATFPTAAAMTRANAVAKPSAVPRGGGALLSRDGRRLAAGALERIDAIRRSPLTHRRRAARLNAVRLLTYL